VRSIYAKNPSNRRENSVLKGYNEMLAVFSHSGRQIILKRGVRGAFSPHRNQPLDVWRSLLEQLSDALLCGDRLLPQRFEGGYKIACVGGIFSPHY